jgi:hypothetical protein
MARCAAWSYRKSSAVAHVSTARRSSAVRESLVDVADELGLGMPGEAVAGVGHGWRW